MRSTAIAIATLLLLGLLCAGLFMLIEDPGAGVAPPAQPASEPAEPEPEPEPAAVTDEPAAAKGPSASLSLDGVVVDAGDQPLPGVAVRASPVGEGEGGRTASAFTDPAGVFELEGLAPGTYRITLELTGYHGGRKNPSQAEAGEGGLRFVLLRGASVRGRVTDMDGNGIDARISAGRGFETRADQDGVYELLSAPAGEVELTASHPEWAAETIRLELVAGESLQDIDFTLDRGLSIAGRVVDTSDVPVVDAVVIASAAPKSRRGRGGAMVIEIEEILGSRSGAPAGALANPKGPHARTDENGNFRIHGLDPGVYQLRPTHDDYLNESVRPEAHPVGKEDILLRMTRAATVTGIVLSPGGEPLPDAGIHLRTRRAASPGGSSGLTNLIVHSMGAGKPNTTSDEKGEFRLTGVRPGSSSLWAAADGLQASETLELELGPGEDRAGVVLQTRIGVSISGRVVTEAGGPVAGAQVLAETSGHFFGGSGQVGMIQIAAPGGLGNAGGPGQAESGSDGSFVIPGLDEGASYELTASKQGYTQVEDRASARVVAPGQGALVTMALGARVIGRVVTAAGEPAAGASVSLRRDWNSSSEKADDDGQFELIDVAPGAYGLRADLGEHGLSDELDVTVAAGETVGPLLLTLGSAGQITGIVVDVLGNPIAEARVRAHSPALMMSGDHRPLSAKTDAEGAFVLDGAEDAVYEVTATAEGFAGSARGGGMILESPVFGAGSPETPNRKNARAGDFVRLELSRGLVVVGQAIAASGEPQASYTVSVLGESQGWMDPELASQRVADAEGRFEILGIDPLKAVEVRIRAQEHAELVIPLPALAGEEYVDLGTLQLREGAHVSGVVVDGSGPVVGANVSIAPRAQEGEEESPVAAVGFTSSVVVSSGFDVFSLGGGGRNARTGEDGSFTFANVADGEFTLTSRHEGFAPSGADVVVSGERSVDGVRIHMTPGGIIEGIVLDATGHPAVGASVRANKPDPDSPVGGVHRRSSTDERGHYEMTGLTAGTYDVSASQGEGPSRASRSAAVEVAEGARVVVDFDDPVLCVLTGQVAGFAQPQIETGPFSIQGSRLYLSRAEGDGASARASLEADGSYRFGPLPPGDYELRGPGGSTFAVTLPATAEHRYDFELPGGRILGKVVRVDGGPLLHAFVGATREGQERAARTGVDAEGNFELRNLAPGTYTLVATMGEYGVGKVEGIDVAGAPVSGVQVVVEPK